MADIFQLFDEIRDKGQLEDRLEYDAEMLRNSYDLTEQEADDLHYLIQRQADPDMLELPDSKLAEKVDANALLEGINEAVHGGLDGWDNPHDCAVIIRFIDDMIRYAKHSK